MEIGSHCTEANVINARLQSFFGRNEEVEEQRFRVVWSDDQLERRLGTFTDTISDTFQREVTEIREVPKYPWLSNQWIVERLVPNVRRDVYDGQYIYEPLYCFPFGLPLKWEAIEVVVKIALKQIDVGSADLIPKTQKEAEYRRDEHLKKEKARTLNLLDNTALQSALHDRAAVALNGEAFDVKVNSDKHDSNQDSGEKAGTGSIIL